MKSLLFGYIIASYVASAASECWSPSMPGPAGCSVCAQDELKGSQCVRSGRWFTCYASAELCCKDGEVLNHVSQDVCVKEANKGQGADSDDDSDSDSDSEDGDQDIDEEECQRVVAQSSITTNRQCMKDCSALLKRGIKPSEDKNWSQQCMTAHWHAENGRTVPDGKCFEKWVYGYSEPNNLASYKLKLEAETPALCQALCQDDDQCVNWVWVSPLYAPGTEVAKRCMLKTQTMVDKPLGMITEQQPAKNLDVDYCNYQMGYSCMNLYKCLACDGERRCVWESDMHISGWKYCDHEDSCSSDTPLKPTSPALPPATTTEPSTTTTPTTTTTTTPTTTTTTSPTTTTTTSPTTTTTTTPTTTTTTPTTTTTTTPSTTTPTTTTPTTTTTMTPTATSTILPVVEKTTPLQGPMTESPRPSPVTTTTLPVVEQTTPLKETPTPSPVTETGEVIQTPLPKTEAPFEGRGTTHPNLVPGGPATVSRQTDGDNVGPTASVATPTAVHSNSVGVASPSLTAVPDCPTQTGIQLDSSSSTTTPLSTSSKAGKCPPSGCAGGCSCCGQRECGCCQNSGIVLRIAERPKHLKFEVSN